MSVTMKLVSESDVLTLAAQAQSYEAWQALKTALDNSSIDASKKPEIVQKAAAIFKTNICFDLQPNSASIKGLLPKIQSFENDPDLKAIIPEVTKEGAKKVNEFWQGLIQKVMNEEATADAIVAEVKAHDEAIDQNKFPALFIKPGEKLIEYLTEWAKNKTTRFSIHKELDPLSEKFREKFFQKGSERFSFSFHTWDILYKIKNSQPQEMNESVTVQCKDGEVKFNKEHLDSYRPARSEVYNLNEFTVKELHDFKEFLYCDGKMSRSLLWQNQFGRIISVSKISKAMGCGQEVQSYILKQAIPKSASDYQLFKMYLESIAFSGVQIENLKNSVLSNWHNYYLDSLTVPTTGEIPSSQTIDSVLEYLECRGRADHNGRMAARRILRILKRRLREIETKKENTADAIVGWVELHNRKIQAEIDKAKGEGVKEDDLKGIYGPLKIVTTELFNRSYFKQAMTRGSKKEEVLKKIELHNEKFRNYPDYRVLPELLTTPKTLMEYRAIQLSAIPGSLMATPEKTVDLKDTLFAPLFSGLQIKKGDSGQFKNPSLFQQVKHVHFTELNNQQLQAIRSSLPDCRIFSMENWSLKHLAAVPYMITKDPKTSEEKKSYFTLCGFPPDVIFPADSQIVFMDSSTEATTNKYALHVNRESASHFQTLPPIYRPVLYVHPKGVEISEILKYNAFSLYTLEKDTYELKKEDRRYYDSESYEGKIYQLRLKNEHQKKFNFSCWDFEPRFMEGPKAKRWEKYNRR